MPIKEALHQTAADPSLTLPPEAYRLIGEYTQKVIFFHIDLVTTEYTANCVRKVWKWSKMNQFSAVMFLIIVRVRVKSKFRDQESRLCLLGREDLASMLQTEKKKLHPHGPLKVSMLLFAFDWRKSFEPMILNDGLFIKYTLFLQLT